MAYVDKLIEAAQRFPGHSIHVVAGEQVSLVSGEDRRPMSNQALINTQYRCPACGRHKTRRWRYIYEEMYVEPEGDKQKQQKEMV